MTKNSIGFKNTKKPTEQKIRRVLIGTPALNGTVHAWYTDSLVNSIKYCGYHGIDLIPIMLINESILPMARNELFKIAYDEKVDCMVFIDSDELWDPQALLEVINSKYDVVGLPVVSKTDEPGKFNVVIKDIKDIERDSNNHIKVDGIGTGFLKISRKAIKSLWESNESTFFRSKELKNICEYCVDENGFIGEDINLCRKLRELNFDIWVNINHTCGHVGDKVWFGNFSEFLDHVTSE
jgi:hypothetical protein